jgi:hypothetical protein
VKEDHHLAISLIEILDAVFGAKQRNPKNFSFADSISHIVDIVLLTKMFQADFHLFPTCGPKHLPFSCHHAECVMRKIGLLLLALMCNHNYQAPDTDVLMISWEILSLWPLTINSCFHFYRSQLLLGK